jgi:putative transcription antitermination factor YqgF
MKYLALDLGLKHTGVAISLEGKTVSPYHTIKADTKEKLIKAIVLQINTERPDQIIIGKPESGSLSYLADRLQEELKNLFPKIDVLLHSEDLTSEITKKRLYQIKANKTKRQQLIHSGSAAIILEDYLEI